VLLVTSGAWFLASLAASSWPFVYSFGRLWTWAVEAALVYVLLAFPSGRLRDRFDRILVAVGVADLLLLLPTAVFVVRYPQPTATSSCYLMCPRNVFMVAAHQPAVIHAVIDPLATVIAAVVWTIVRLTVFVVFVSVRWAAPGSGVAEAAGWALALMMPALGLAFLVGLGRWHLFVSAGVRTVNTGLRVMPGPGEVRDLLASAFDDPGLEIACWSNRRHRWITSGADTLNPPGAGSDHRLTEVRDGRRRDVAIVHDVELGNDPAFLEAAAAAATIAFATDRVAARTSALVRELKAARSRIVAAGDSERQRIERDLHDGAQQHLVALGIHLELAAEKADVEQPADAQALRELAAEVDQALEQLRALTRGISPSMLASRGLAESVRSAAVRSPVPTTVEAKGLRDYPDEITTAVYFCCLEALQNVAKHAKGAHSAHIELRDADSVLSFSVSDDGPGISDRDARVGAGMINMRDRMTTVGGKLSVQSRPGQGNRVSGRIPLAALDRTGAARDHPPGPRRAPTARGRERMEP
jgi:signal transduction histidine kinase